MRRAVIVLLLFLFALCPACAFKSPAPSSPTVEEMAGAMLMVGFEGTSAPRSVLDAVAAGRLGGVILFDRGRGGAAFHNIVSPGQVKALTSSLQAVAPRPIFVAVDQEGGKVRRLKTERGFLPLPSAESMGRMPADEVRNLGLRAGREMTSLGINVDLAPVVDVRLSSRSPGLGDAGRLFGADAALVTRQALAFADGLMQAGVVPALKHFPGLGSAGEDSHHQLPDVTRRWQPAELLPYEEAFGKGWPGMVLVAHIYHRGMDESLPSSLSPAVIEGLLRRDMGWDGVVISDDLQMGAVSGRALEERVRLALLAGNDILLFGNYLKHDENLHEKVFQAVLHLVQSGEVSRERLERSWRRIETVKRRFLGVTD